MKTQWLIIAALFPALSFSQAKKPGSSLNSIVSVGVVAGESAAKPLFQAATGLVYGRYFTGIGVGLDYYKFKSIPLFVDWRVDFDRKRMAFVYANGGYNFPFDNHSSFNWVAKTTDEFRGGLFMDAGVGYSIRLNSVNRLLISTGYTLKSIRNKVGYISCPILPPCFEEFYTYKYNLGRITTKLSWEFGKRK